MERLWSSYRAKTAPNIPLGIKELGFIALIVGKYAFLILGNAPTIFLRPEALRLRHQRRREAAGLWNCSLLAMTAQWRPN